MGIASLVLHGGIPHANRSSWWYSTGFSFVSAWGGTLTSSFVFVFVSVLETCLNQAVSVLAVDSMSHQYIDMYAGVCDVVLGGSGRFFHFSFNSLIARALIGSALGIYFSRTVEQGEFAQKGGYVGVYCLLLCLDCCSGR